MSKVTITIDGKACEVEEGEYILNAARANDIFIPAICYLTRCSPTLACRVCLVEADGKQVYACNAKAKDGMSVVTTTPTILEERRAIMEVYDVNHPLECGVCDQSGECELQNYTLLEGVDSQHYSIPDTHKVAQNWGLLNYDPALCIVCERCVTVCKDMIGDGALSTVARGSETIHGEYKATMPKDAYAMWNKLNKSLIGPNAGDHLDCTNCGECSAVCPVGALVSSDFQYKTNAWELTKVPATCSHCSAGCHIYYEKKHTSVSDSTEYIYRVQNEWNYQSLCGAGRYGFDFENRRVGRDAAAFARAVDALKKAQTIAFTSQITNEEALMLQRLKERLGLKLYNPQAYAYAQFLRAYSSVSGSMLYGTTLGDVHESDFVISVGSALKTDNPAARFALNNALTVNKGAALYFHPVKDTLIEGLSKNIATIYHKAGLEEAVLYLILDLFGDKEKLPNQITTYLASFHSTKTITVEESIKEKVVEKVLVKKLNEATGVEEEVEEEKVTMVPKTITKEVTVDENRLLEMVGASATFMETLEKLLAKKERFSLMVGEDLYGHKAAANLARLVGLIEKYSAFGVVIIPPLGNALGVALLCDLDAKAQGYTVGYNASGDFTMGALAHHDLALPAMNQQEGTFTTINKQVVPTNAALPFEGYELNDVVNAVLGTQVALTIDYTAMLGGTQGYKNIAFDALDNYFTNSGESKRGYVLGAYKTATTDEAVAPIDASSSFDATIYHADPVLQFNDFTAKSHQIAAKGGLYLSSSLAATLGIDESHAVNVTANGMTVVMGVVIDSKIDGDIAWVSRFDSSLPTQSLFNGYRFNQAKISKG
ncbi:MAG: ferredoxin [Sulfuricurvum sp. PC08-66]|nr:MAG: ferredoxin [Sulfuricurvum sp. PC08-66]